MAKALIKISVKNAGNLNPDPVYASLNFSHPELTERLSALRYVPKKNNDKEEKKEEIKA